MNFLPKNKKIFVDFTNFLYTTKLTHFPLRGKVGQLSKRKRVLCWSIYIISLWPPLTQESLKKTWKRVVSAICHCCQIAENSAILVKRSGKKYLFAEEFDSGTAIKFSLK